MKQGPGSGMGQKQRSPLEGRWDGGDLPRTTSNAKRDRRRTELGLREEQAETGAGGPVIGKAGDSQEEGGTLADSTKSRGMADTCLPLQVRPQCRFHAALLHTNPQTGPSQTTLKKWPADRAPGFSPPKGWKE